MHQGFEAREVVGEIRQSLAGGRREHEMAGTGEGCAGQESRVEIGGRPAERGERLAQVGVGDLLDMRFDTGECGRDGPALLGHPHRHGTGACREDQLPGADPLRQRDGGRDGGVPAERHLGLGTEVADAVRPSPLPVDPLGLLGQEGGLRVSEVSGDRQHVVVVEAGGVQHDTGRVSTVGRAGEGGVAQHLGPLAVRRHAYGTPGDYSTVPKIPYTDAEPNPETSAGPHHGCVQLAYAAGPRMPLGQFDDDPPDGGPVADLAGAGPEGVQQCPRGLLGPLPGPPGARHVGAQPGLALGGRELVGPQVLPRFQGGPGVPQRPVDTDRIEVDVGIGVRTIILDTVAYAAQCVRFNDGQFLHHVPHPGPVESGSVMRTARIVAADDWDVDLPLWRDGAGGDPWRRER